MNNPEVWMRYYLAYIEDIAEGISINQLTDLIHLPAKELSPFWQQKWDELGWEMIKSYGSILFSAAGKKNI